MLELQLIEHPTKFVHEKREGKKIQKIFEELIKYEENLKPISFGSI